MAKVEVIHWRSRDIGYGVDRGVSIGRFTGFDTWGKRTFEPIGGETLYLFPDEIVRRKAATIEEVEQAAFVAGYHQAKQDTLDAIQATGADFTADALEEADL